MLLLAIEDITACRYAENLVADDYSQKLQQQVQELERLSLLKDDFLSTVSHELRSPMTTIRMASQMLEVGLQQAELSQSLTQKLNRYIQILNQECRRETNLINDLLDLSHLDAGGEALELTALDLQVWLPEIVKPFESVIQSHKQQLHMQVPESSTAFPPIIPGISVEQVWVWHLRSVWSNTYRGRSKPKALMDKLTCL